MPIVVAEGLGVLSPPKAAWLLRNANAKKELVKEDDNNAAAAQIKVVHVGHRPDNPYNHTWSELRHNIAQMLRFVKSGSTLTLYGQSGILKLAQGCSRIAVRSKAT